METEEISGELRAKVLCNHLILDNIFKFLPLKDLFSFSETCKVYCNQVRKYIQKHRISVVKLDSSEWMQSAPCVTLRDLDELLSKSFTAEVPIHGIFPGRPSNNYLKPHHVTPLLCPHACVPRSRGTNVAALYPAVLRRIKWKYYCINWASDLDRSDCPAIQFLKYVLREKIQNFQVLEIHGRPWTLTQTSFFRYVGAVPQLLWNLKKFSFSGLGQFLHNSPDRSRKQLLLEVVAHAPNLRRIEGYAPSRMFGPVPGYNPWDDPMKGLYFPRNMLQHIKHVEQVSPALLWELARAEPRLEILYMTLYTGNGHTFNPPGSMSLVSDSLIRLTRSSWDTLKYLSCSMTQFALFSKPEMTPLVNLISLRICWIGVYGSNVPNLAYRDFGAFRKCNYGRVFPKLSSLVLTPWPFQDSIDGLMVMYEFLKSQQEFQCTTLESIDCKRSEGCSKGQLLSLSHAFPNVRDFRQEAYELEKKFWQFRWPKLETLFCKYFYRSLTLDVLLLGMSREEAMYLSTQTLEFQLKYQWAAPNYSIINSALNTMYLDYCDCSAPGQITWDILTPFAAKMISLYLPDLRITLRGKSRDASYFLDVLPVQLRKLKSIVEVLSNHSCRSTSVDTVYQYTLLFNPMFL